jgi:hypothetical protein
LIFKKDKVLNVKIFCDEGRGRIINYGLLVKKEIVRWDRG